MARIYVASSWRNPFYPDVVGRLKAEGLHHPLAERQFAAAVPTPKPAGWPVPANASSRTSPKW